MSIHTRPHETTFLYVILMDGDEASWPVYKVGIARNVESRLNQLQTGCPFKLDISHTVAFPSRELALVVEAEVHDLLSGKALSGEWFRAHLDEILIAIQHAAIGIAHRLSLPAGGLDEFLGFVPAGAA